MSRLDNRQSESGSALVAVLCLIFTAGMLAAATLMLSKYGTFTIQAHVELQKSLYINEGVANRVQYLIAADRSLYSTVEVGRTDYAEYEHDRFFADGVVHHLNYYGTPVEFTITDACSGYDLSAGNFQNTLNRISNSDLFDETLHDSIDNLSAALTDYMDSGDELSLNGFEEADYEDIGMSPLPRNSAPQFREELAWVVGGAEVYRQLLPFCALAVVTRNHVVRPADAFFPDLDADPAWSLVEVSGAAAVQPGDGDAGVEYDFATYARQPEGARTL